MAPDTEILPRSRSRHLLRQETGAPALRKTTRCRIETKPGRVEVRRVWSFIVIRLRIFTLSPI